MSGVKEIDTGQIRQLIIAGWTGRNQDAVEAHIRELEAIGVKRPKTTPIFYRVSAALLTTQDTIDVLGENSSGEVECVLHAIDGDIFVGVGSDHTDRKAETAGVSLSKQMCAKPVSPQAWRLADVAPHWDKLMLRSFVRINGERRLYQEGSVATMRPPEELCRLWSGDSALPQHASMFCGTLAVHGGIVSADRFEMELEDPVLNRKITHAYRVQTLPDEG
ncbi:MAG: DUF2848 domain-containing protein [Pseudorhodoplanes sp.]|uniref:DUF2848 domain-containing protein n=1 Tax=Pseudorhodoplanes sp. TaxID=1934341 RepID=UPI003D0AA5DC